MSDRVHGVDLGTFISIKSGHTASTTSYVGRGVRSNWGYATSDFGVCDTIIISCRYVGSMVILKPYLVLFSNF